VPVPRRLTSATTPGRLAAGRALLEIEDGAFAEDALAAVAPTDPRERAHAWFLTLGVLQRRGQVDAALRERLERPLDGLDPAARVALRVGAFEKLFGRAADHAVVDQGVELARGLGAGRAAGLVNAVLRRVAPATELARHDGLDHPAWLLARWTDRYGAEAAERWCRANGEPAPLVVVVRPDRAGVLDRLRAAGLALEPATAAGRPVEGAWIVSGHDGSVDALPGLAEGDLWVQDPAAVAVADLCAPRPGLRVLDACAAPGGKSLRLASRGAAVVAVDRAERLARLTEAVARTGLPIQVVAHDWETGPSPALPRDFDVVLVDAPCTGLGTVRRHPEIRWRRQPADLPRAAGRQLAILRAAAAHARPGGAVVYAVCSSEPEEGAAVVEAWRAETAGAAVVEGLLTAPPAADEDAHYAARVRLHHEVES
jgi:16S rRNA (cytosine967-C5)-methyltransferase